MSPFLAQPPANSGRGARNHRPAEPGDPEGQAGILREAYGISLELRASIRPRLTAAGTFQAVDQASIEIPDPRILISRSKTTGRERQHPCVAADFRGRKAPFPRPGGRVDRGGGALAIPGNGCRCGARVKVNHDDVLFATGNKSDARGIHRPAGQRELTDQTTLRRRYAPVQRPPGRGGLANAKPKLIGPERFRITKNNLATRLGWNIPTNTTENIPLELADRLEARPFDLASRWRWPADCSSVRNWSPARRT